MSAGSMLGLLFDLVLLVWVIVLSLRRDACNSKWDDQIAINRDQIGVNNEQLRINAAQLKINDGALARRCSCGGHG